MRGVGSPELVLWFPMLISLGCDLEQATEPVGASVSSSIKWGHSSEILPWGCVGKSQRAFICQVPGVCVCVPEVGSPEVIVVRLSDGPSPGQAHVPRVDYLALSSFLGLSYPACGWVLLRTPCLPFKGFLFYPGAHLSSTSLPLRLTCPALPWTPAL